jgi:hypothetical protein
MRLFRGLRELVASGDSQQDQQVLSLTGCLSEVAADFLPVALKRNVKVALLCEVDASSGRGLVSVQATRLRQGLLHLLEFALEGCPQGAEIQITSAEDGELARVMVAVPTVQPPELVTAKAGAQGRSVVSADDSMNVKQRELKRRLALAIARRSFEGADGSLHVRDGANSLCLEVGLPLALLPQ